MSNTSGRIAYTTVGVVLAIFVLATGPATIAGPSLPTPTTADPVDIRLLDPYTVNRAGCVSLASPSQLIGDVDGDGYVNVGDLQFLVACWARAYGEPGFNPEADFNCDSYINVGDLQLMVSNWGTSS